MYIIWCIYIHVYILWLLVSIWALNPVYIHTSKLTRSSGACASPVQFGIRATFVRDVISFHRNNLVHADFDCAFCMTGCEGTCAVRIKNFTTGDQEADAALLFLQCRGHRRKNHIAFLECALARSSRGGVRRATTRCGGGRNEIISPRRHAKKWQQISSQQEWCSLLTCCDVICCL